MIVYNNLGTMKAALAKRDVCDQCAPHWRFIGDPGLPYPPQASLITLYTAAGS